MSKTADAFRTIGEVADELDVPKHVLRFWEGKFPHIRPMKRGGGRRYYRPEDMELLRGIRHLLHAEGYTIKGVQKILREQGIDQVKATAAAGMAAAETARSVKQRSRTASASHKKATAARSGAIDGAADVALDGAASKRAQSASTKSSGKSTQEIVADAIRELEICRQLLAPSSAKVAASTDPVARATRT